MCFSSHESKLDEKKGDELKMCELINFFNDAKCEITKESIIEFIEKKVNGNGKKELINQVKNLLENKNIFEEKNLEYFHCIENYSSISLGLNLKYIERGGSISSVDDDKLFTHKIEYMISFKIGKMICEKYKTREFYKNLLFQKLLSNLSFSLLIGQGVEKNKEMYDLLNSFIMPEEDESKDED